MAKKPDLQNGEVAIYFYPEDKIKIKLLKDQPEGTVIELFDEDGKQQVEVYFKANDERVEPAEAPATPAEPAGTDKGEKTQADGEGTGSEGSSVGSPQGRKLFGVTFRSKGSGA